MSLAIKAEGLSKTYTGEGAPVTVFSGLSFEVPEGTLAASIDLPTLFNLGNRDDGNVLKDF